MAKFPPDRFDGVPDSLLRVGAHRSGGSRHHGWIVFAWAALATGVLVGVGVLVLTLANGSFQFTEPPATVSGTPRASTSSSPPPTSASPKPSSTPTAPPVTPIDPSQIDSAATTISVLNGTTTAGLAASASTTLTNGGWVVATQGNAPSPAPTSIVYYSTSAADNKGIALGIAQKLGIATVQESTAFPNSTIAVVLGSDYKDQ